MSRESRQRKTEESTSRKGNWYLITGLLIGILLGLVISWVITPVKYVDTMPASLRADFKEEFRSRIASAFFATHNLPRAQARLALLGDLDPIQSLTIQAQNLVASGDPTGSAYVLAFLIDALKQASNEPSITDTLTPPPAVTHTGTPNGSKTPSSQTSTRQPTSLSTLTPRPTSTSSVTPGSPFILKSNQTVCDKPEKSLLLQVEVNNSAGQPIPGAEIVITWSNGEEHFFTGLKPEFGDGYADYLMSPDVVYIVQLAQGGAPVRDLSAPLCSTGSSLNVWGSLKLIFQQP